MQDKQIRYQVALANRVHGINQTNHLLFPTRQSSEQGFLLRKQEQALVEQRFIEDTLSSRKSTNGTFLDSPSQRFLRSKKQTMSQEDSTEDDVAIKLHQLGVVDFSAIKITEGDVNKFPEIQNLNSYSRNVGNNWASDYHDRKGRSVVARKKNDFRFRIVPTEQDRERIQYTLRQTFDSTKAHSSVDDRSKSDLCTKNPAFASQQIEQQQLKLQPLKVSHGMQIEKSVIDAQTFMQDKEKRHETAFTQLIDKHAQTKWRQTEAPSMGAIALERSTGQLNSISYLPNVPVVNSAEVVKAAHQTAARLSPRRELKQHQFHISAANTPIILKRGGEQFMTPQKITIGAPGHNSAKQTKAMSGVLSKKSSVQWNHIESGLTDEVQNHHQIQSNQQLLRVLQMSDTEQAQKKSRTVLRRRASTLKTKITLMPRDKSTAANNDGTLLLQRQLDNVAGNTQHDAAASSQHRKKLHRKLAARKQKIVDEQRHLIIVDSPEKNKLGVRNKRSNQKRAESTLNLPDVLAQDELNQQALKQNQVTNSALGSLTEQKQRLQINQNSYNNQNHILGVPLINKNQADTGFGKQQNNSVKDVAEANLSRQTYQAQVDGESGTNNQRLNKMYSNSSKKHGATGASQGKDLSGDKTSGMIFRVLAPSKRESLEPPHNVTSSNKKRQMKQAGATSSGRVAALNQTTQPSSNNMRNFSSAAKKSGPAPMKDNLTAGESSQAHLVPKLGLSPKHSPTSRMYKKQLAHTEAKSRVNNDLRESLTGNLKTAEPSMGQGLVAEAAKAQVETKANTEATSGPMAGIKSSYGKDLISALSNNNNSSKLAGVAAGNRQESSESNQNEGGVVDDQFIEDPTKQARSRLQEITGKKSIHFDDFADYDINVWCKKQAVKSRKHEPEQLKSAMPAHSKAYSLTEKRRHEVDEKDIEELKEPVSPMKSGQFALNSLSVKSKVSERCSHEEQSQPSPFHKHRVQGGKLLKPLRIDAQRGRASDGGGGEGSSAFGGLVSEKDSQCSSGMKYGLGQYKDNGAGASDEINSDDYVEEDLVNSEDEEPIYAEAKSDEAEMPKGQVNDETDPNSQEMQAVLEELILCKEENAHRLPNPQQEKANSHLAAYLGQAPFMSASSWAIYDCRRGRLLASKKESERREVASITKMMTFYTSILLINEFRLDYNRTFVTISKFASEIIGTTAKLVEGDVLSLKQLFYGMMLPSGNDAAHTLAEFFGNQILEKRRVNYNKQFADAKARWDRTMVYSHFQNNNAIKMFLWEMNRNARNLGMFDTFYDSPHGLRNDRNFSTTYDVCLLTQECMKIQVFRQVVNTRVFEAKARANDVSPSSTSFETKKLSRYKWETTNRLLGCFEGLIGSKTGITAAAGPCFSGYYEKDEFKLALVLANSRTMEVRWIEIQKMVHWIQRATKNRKATILREKKKLKGNGKGSQNNMLNSQMGSSTVYNRR